MTHDERLHDCAVAAARLYENLKHQEAERTRLRREWLALLAKSPELKALDKDIATAERGAKSLKDALKDALSDWQVATAEAYKDGWSNTKTFQDGMVTAVTRNNVVVESDSSAMLQFGVKVVKEFPEYIGILFKPDPAGFKKLATENPKALQQLGFLAVPPEVMRVEPVVGGRINKGWEEKALELLPIPTRAGESARVLLGDYPPEFHEIAPLIRERDQWSCMAGDCTEYGDGLHVHHINHDKTDNRPVNLITLCRVCHGQFGNDEAANRQFAMRAARRSWDTPGEWRDEVLSILGTKIDWQEYLALAKGA